MSQKPSQRGKSRKRVLLGVCLFGGLLFLVILPGVFLFLTLQTSPLVPASIAVEVEDAARVRSLAAKTHRVLFEPQQREVYSVSEDELNAVLRFASRSLSRFTGTARVWPDYLEIKGTLRLPPDRFGLFFNMGLDLRPSSSSGLNIEEASIGTLRISGAIPMSLLGLLLKGAIGGDQRDMLQSSLKDVQFSDRNMVFVLDPLSPLQTDRLRYMKDQVKFLRDYARPLGDPQTVRAYYSRLRDISKDHEDKEAVSLSRFMEGIFALAKERSLSRDPVIENHAAVLALAMFAGSHRFEAFIGPVRTEEMKQSPPDTRNIVLAGRRDLRLHFVISAGLKLLSDSRVSFAIGEFKELLDSASGGSGFSFADYAADRAGVRFAEWATQSEYSARKLQSVLSRLYSESSFFPWVLDLPEDLSQEDFERMFGAVDSPKYLALITEIDQRIDQAYAYLLQEQAK